MNFNRCLTLHFERIVLLHISIVWENIFVKENYRIYEENVLRVFDERSVTLSKKMLSMYLYVLPNKS